MKETKIQTVVTSHPSQVLADMNTLFCDPHISSSIFLQVRKIEWD